MSQFNFLRAVSSVSGLTVLSRFTGYLRDLLVAYFLGVSATSDALALAIKLPSFFRRFFAEGALHVSFLPIFSHLSDEKDPRKAKIFAGMVFFCLIAGLSICIITTELFFPVIARNVYGTMAHERSETFEIFIRFGMVTLPHVFFISISSFFGSLLNASGRFNSFAVSQALGNSFIVVCVLIFSRWTEDRGHLFAWAIVLSGVTQFLCVFIDAARKGLCVWPKLPKWTPELRRFFLKLGPGALGVGVLQLNIFLAAFFASQLPEGSLSYLLYADRLNQLPHGLVAVSLGAVLLPMLAHQIKRGEFHSVNKTLNHALRLAVFLTFPCAIFFLTATGPLSTLLFGYGKLTTHNLLQVKYTVMAFSLGVPSYVFIKILNTRFFAQGNTKTPLVAALASLIVDVVVTLVLMKSLKHVGIALATACGAWANVLVLGFALYRKKEWRPSKMLIWFTQRVALSCGVMAVSLWGVQYLFFPHGLNETRFFIKLAQAVTMGGVGAGAFLCSAKAFKLFSLRQLRVLKNAFFKPPKRSPVNDPLVPSAAQKGV